MDGVPKKSRLRVADWREAVSLSAAWEKADREGSADAKQAAGVKMADFLQVVAGLPVGWLEGVDFVTDELAFTRREGRKYYDISERRDGGESGWRVMHCDEDEERSCEALRGYRCNGWHGFRGNGNTATVVFGHGTALVAGESLLSD